MARARSVMVVVSVLGVLALTACQEVSVAEPEVGPANVEPIGASGLSRVTLTEKAAARIGVEVAPIRQAHVTRALSATGEVLAPAAGGATTVEIKVALNASDFARIDHEQVARILPQPGQEAGAITARVTREEQTAGYGDGAVFYAPETKAHGLAPGQRALVEVPLKGSGATRLTVPYQAILYDSSGATWVYTNPAALVYERAPVKVDYVDGDTAVLIEGPKAGTPVVTVGVSELYGAEVGVGE
jgi:hypothetical protein